MMTILRHINLSLRFSRKVSEIVSCVCQYIRVEYEKTFKWMMNNRDPVTVLDCLKDNRVHLQLLKAVKTYSIVLKTAEYTYSFAAKMSCKTYSIVLKTQKKAVIFRPIRRQY